MRLKEEIHIADVLSRKQRAEEDSSSPRNLDVAVKEYELFTIELLPASANRHGKYQRSTEATSNHFKGMELLFDFMAQVCVTATSSAIIFQSFPQTCYGGRTSPQG